MAYFIVILYKWSLDLQSFETDILFYFATYVSEAAFTYEVMSGNILLRLIPDAIKISPLIPLHVHTDR